MGSLQIKGTRVLAFILAISVCMTENQWMPQPLLVAQAEVPQASAIAEEAGEEEADNQISVGELQLDTQKKEIVLNGNAVIFRKNDEGETVLYLDHNRNGLVENSDTVIAVEHDETIEGSFADYTVYGVLGQETGYDVVMVMEDTCLSAVYGVKDGAARKVNIDIKGESAINTVVAVDNGYCGNAATLAIEDASGIGVCQLAVKAIIGGAAKVTVAGLVSSNTASVNNLCRNSTLYGTVTASITNTDAVVRVLEQGCTAYKDVIIYAGGQKRGIIYGNYGADIKGNLSCSVSGNIERLYALMNGTVGGNISIEAKEYCGDIYGSYGGNVGGDVRLWLSDCLSKQNVYGAWEGLVKGSVILDAVHCSYRDIYGVYKLSEECKGVEMYLDDTDSNGDVYGAYGTSLTADDGQAIMLSLNQCAVQYVCAERDCGEIKGAVTMRGNKLTRDGSQSTIYVTRGTAWISGGIVCRLSGEIDDFYGMVDNTNVAGNMNITLLGDGSATSAAGSGNKTILQGSGCVVQGDVQVRMQQQSAYYFYGNNGGVVEGDFKLAITGFGYISELDVNTGCVKGDVEAVLNNVTISYNLFFNLGEIQGNATASYSILGEMGGSYIGNRGGIAGVYDVTVQDMSVYNFLGNEASVGEAYYLKLYNGNIGSFNGTVTPVKLVCIDRIGGSYNQGRGISTSGGVNGYDNDRGNVTFYGSYQLDKERSFETVTVSLGSRLTIGETGAVRTEGVTNNGVIINCGVLSSQSYVEYGPIFYYAGEISLFGDGSLSQCSLIYYPISIETDLADVKDNISISATAMDIDNQTVYFAPKDSLVTMHVTDEERFYLEQLRVWNQLGEQLPSLKQSFVMPEGAVSCELICQERHTTQPEEQQNIFVDDITKKITVYHDDILIKKLPNGNTAICDDTAGSILYEGDLSDYHVQLQAAGANVPLHKVLVESGEIKSLSALQGTAGTVENVELIIAEDACINKVFGLVDSTISGELRIEDRSSQTDTLIALSGSNAEQGYLIKQKEQITVGGAYCFHEDIQAASLAIEQASNALLPEGITITAQDISINGALDVQGTIKADNIIISHDLTVQETGELFVEDTLTCKGRIYLLGQITATHINHTAASNAVIVMGGRLYNTDGVYVYYPYTLFWNQEQVNARYDSFDSNTIVYEGITYGKRNSSVKLYVSAKTDYQIDDIRVNGISQYEQYSGYVTITMPDEAAKLEIISSAIHEWGEWIVEQEAACDTQGREVSTCNLCGETKQRAIPALGHLYQGDWDLVTLATADRAGKAIRRCQREGCNNPEQEQLLPAMSYHFEDAWCVYDGAAHLLMPDIYTPQNVTVSYSLNNGEYKTECPKLIEAGCYEVSCKIEAEGYETEIAVAKLTIYQNQTEEPSEPESSVTPTTEEKTTTTEEVTPTTEEAKSTTEERKPTTEETTSTTEEVTTTEEKTTTTEEAAPTTEEKNPTTEEAAPTTEEKNPTTEEAAPTTKEKNPTTEETAPTTEEKNPTTGEVTPTTEEQTSTPEEAASTTEEKNLTTQDTGSTTQEAGPAAEDNTSEPDRTIAATGDKSPDTEEIVTSNDKGSTPAETSMQEAETVPKVISFSSGNLRYRVISSSKRTVAVTGYKKAKAKLVIPAKVTYQGVKYQITGIDKKAFYKNKKVKRVTIKTKKITTIGTLAFRKKNHITFSVPKGKKKAYTKLLKKYGIVK